MPNSDQPQLPLPQHKFSYYEDLWQDLAVDDAQVTLRVTVPVVPATAPAQATHLAIQALRQFIPGVCRLTQMLSSADDSSIGSWLLASAQVPLEHLGELPRRAFEASTADVQLTDPVVRHGVAPDVQVANFRALALQAFAAAQIQAAAPSAPSQRAWRVGHVECHCPRPFPLSNVSRSKHLADATADRFDGAMSAWQRLGLLAQVTLVSNGASAS